MTKKLAIIFGIIFILVGILGFIPNNVMGQNAIFVTDGILNMIYVITGIILLIAGILSVSASTMWLRIFGVIYLIFFLDGLFQPLNLLGFITTNSNDIWLHFVVAVILFIAGYSTKSRTMVDKSMM